MDMFLRCSVGTMGILCNFWAVDHMRIADANILNKLSPFFAILMSIFILKERPNRVEWLSVLLAFIGAAFVAKPGAGIASFPALIAILGGFTAGTAYTYVRKLGLSGVKGPVIVFSFSVFSTLILLPNILLNYHPMSVRQFIFLVLAGCSAAFAQLSVTAAYQNAPARDISVFDYSQVVYAAMFGFLLWGEIPDAWSFLGYAIIIGTAFGKWYWQSDLLQVYLCKKASSLPDFSVIGKKPVSLLLNIRDLRVHSSAKSIEDKSLDSLHHLSKVLRKFLR